MTYRISFARIALALLASGSVAVAAANASNASSSALQRPPLTRAAQLADLKVVRNEYLPKEMAYTPATRAQAEALLDRMQKQAGTLTTAQFEVGLAQVGALTDNAHSGLRLSDPRAKPLARLPLRLLWLPDALIVARATGAAADLAGARVLEVEGRSPEALFEGAKVLLGGSVAGRRIWLNDWIESAGILHALGLAKSPGQISLKVRLRDGRTLERTLAMVPVADLSPTAAGERLWSPEPVKEEKGWNAALDTDRLPLYLRDADAPFRVAPLQDLQDLHALYVQFRWNQDEEGFPIAKFLDDVRKRIADSHPTNLVVDLRFDIGGNLLTTLDFMRKLATSVDGHTYLLVGSYTFSAGIISAAAIKKHGGERVTVVGDELGDRMHFWSEGALIMLPNSHYAFRYTNGQFNLKDGCSGEPACMDDLYPIDVNFASLVPELRAPLTAADYFAGRDPALEAVGTDLARRSHAQ
jgi:hypothetical protein